MSDARTVADRRGRGGERTYLVWAAVAAGIWVVAATWLVPLLIGQAYRGESIPLLNRMLSGRGSHSLADYLEEWWSVAFRLSAVLLGATVLGWCLVRWWRPVRALLAPILFGEPSVSAASGFLLAVGLGLGSGVLEFVAWKVRYIVDRRFIFWSNPDTVWLAPLTLAVAFGVLFAPFALAARVARRPLAVRPILIAFLALGVFGFVRTLRLGLYPIAVVVLAVGIAVLVSRAVVNGGFVGARRFRTRVIAAVAVFVLIALASTGGRRLRERWLLSALPDAARGAPNVLLIILDTVRSESLGLYGYFRPTTPRLERLARRGITFDRAFSPSPWTLPAHATIFTGRHPYEHGADWRTSLDGRYPTLAEFLKQHGYATAGFVANLGYTTRESGLDRGFVHYADYDLGLEVILSSTRVTEAAANWAVKTFLGRQTLLRKTAPEVNREFLDWLDRGQGTRPFFAFLNYFDAHGPYRRHQEFLDRFPPLPASDSVLSPRYEWWPRPERHRESLDSYESSVAYLDDQLGALFDELERRGVLDETLVVVTSDHGEQFGERGMIDHGNTLYAPLLHVPLIVVAPDSDGGLAGLRYPDPVSLRDLPATIAAVLNLDAAAPFPGHSILDGLGQGEDTGPMEGPVLSEVTPEVGVEHHDFLRFGRAASLLRGDLHYIRRGNGEEELYSLSADPAEAVNLTGVPGAARELRMMRNRLDAVLGADGRMAPAAVSPTRSARRIGAARTRGF